jgi:sigma-B regulation protein RsbU (phosphoserine phosphatase)
VILIDLDDQGVFENRKRLFYWPGTGKGNTDPIHAYSVLNQLRRKNFVNRQKNPKLRETVWNDIRHGNIQRTLAQDFRDLYEFYIDPKTRERFNRYGWFRRGLSASWRILKQAILRLTPGRRILFVLSILLAISSGSKFNPSQGDVQLGIEFNTASYALLMIVLMLELKDKLLARNELETGRSVQIALMPEEQPRIPGWDVWLYTKPANDVGGDLIDHLVINETCHGIAIGDVSGKGLGAALLMAKLQATIHALAPIKKNFPWLGKELNQIFCRECLPTRFASLIYLELCPEKGQIQMLNAGHLPPVVLRGFKIEEIPHANQAIGLSAKAPFKEQTVDLNSGDFLFLYSDGVSEAQDKSGGFFGEDRVLELVKSFRYKSAEECGKMVLDAVASFTVNARPTDDLSLIIIKRKS